MSREPKIYTLRPASGQALLNYRNRLGGNVAMPLYEADTIEQVRDEKDTAPDNYLLQSDCLSTCAWLKAQNMTVDLVYIDPPFASGADYAKKIWLRGNGKKQVNGDQSLSEEVMYGDIWKKEDYLNWLYERLLAIREVMSETGSIYVHLDWHIGHYAKVLMDEVFGEDNFINEIIWCYRGGGNAKNKFKSKHDCIYLYKKQDDPVFNWKDVARAYEKLPLTGSWRNNTREEAEKKAREKMEEGMVPYDWWDDIPAYATATRSPERLDYPTQKPEDLLERIIKASSDKGMLVADFFSGSGTTAKVAHDLDRRFVVSDIGQHALQITRDRLVKASAHFDILKVRDGVRLFRNPAQTEQKIFSLLPGWQSRDKADLGEFWEGSMTEGDRNVPVKFVGIEKKLTMDLISVVLEEAGKADAGKVLVLYAHREMKVTPEALSKEAKRHQHSDALVEIRSLDEFLQSKTGQIVVEDSADLTVIKKKETWQVTLNKYYSPWLNDKVNEHNARANLENDNRITLSDTGLEAIECLQFGTMSKKGVWKSEKNFEYFPADNEVVGTEYEVPAKVSHLKIRNIAGDEIILNLMDKAK